jgi:4-hydroxy-tetrahydrodipicolinate reductase
MSAHCKLILLGASGKMGQAIQRILESQKSIELIQSIHSKTPSITNSNADKNTVILDVSRPSACVDLMRKYLNTSHSSLPSLIAGSTGWNQEQLEVLRQYSEQAPVLVASNFSPLVQMIVKFLEQNTKSLDALGYKASIHEIHHTQKVDAPSGTALTLAKAIEAKGLVPQLSSVRAGDIVGTHVVGFYGKHDLVEIRHEAFNRDLFAQGALDATSWIFRRRLQNPTMKGCFSMSDILESA